MMRYFVSRQHPAIGRVLVACLCALQISIVFAHSDLVLNIQQLTDEIRQSPRDHALYTTRGNLYRQHSEWSKANDDFNKSLELLADNANALISLGRTHLEAKQYQSAVAVLSRYLSLYPDDVRALILRSRAYQKLARYHAAIDDAAAYMLNSPRVTPAMYFDKAKLHELAKDYAGAVYTLETGLKKLSGAVILVKYAIELNVEHHQYEAALKNFDYLTPRLAAMPVWLSKRADILVLMKRTTEAAENYRLARKAFHALPASRRNAPANQKLERHIHARIAGS